MNVCQAYHKSYCLKSSKDWGDTVPFVLGLRIGNRASSWCYMKAEKIPLKVLLHLSPWTVTSLGWDSQHIFLYYTACTFGSEMWKNSSISETYQSSSHKSPWRIQSSNFLDIAYTQFWCSKIYTNNNRERAINWLINMRDQHPVENKEKRDQSLLLQDRWLKVITEIPTTSSPNHGPMTQFSWMFHLKHERS